MRILVVEDDLDLSANLAEHLEGEGHDIDFAYDGPMALSLAEQNDYDIILLDLGLPRIDGVNVVRTLRRAGCAMPVLAITARDSIGDKAAAFGEGVDDYLVKPFELRELSLRIDALRRRGNQTLASTILRVNDLTLETETGHCRREGVTIRLNPSQTTILKLLMLAAPNLVSREELNDALWQGEPPSRDALRMHVFELRALLDKPFAHALIHTVRGRGYCLDASL